MQQPPPSPGYPVGGAPVDPYVQDLAGRAAARVADGEEKRQIKVELLAQGHHPEAVAWALRQVRGVSWRQRVEGSPWLYAMVLVGAVLWVVALVLPAGTWVTVPDSPTEASTSSTGLGAEFFALGMLTFPVSALAVLGALGSPRDLVEIVWPLYVLVNLVAVVLVAWPLVGRPLGRARKALAAVCLVTLPGYFVVPATGAHLGYHPIHDQTLDVGVGSWVWAVALALWLAASLLPHRRAAARTGTQSVAQSPAGSGTRSRA